MSENQPRSFRYERKFLVDQLDAVQVRAMIKRHSCMFYEPYPPRYVNNLYLDTPDMSNYYDNVSGVGERRKVRIRWYHGLFGDVEEPVLEFKIKKGLVGTKRSFPFAPFALDDGFSANRYQASLCQADLPDHIRQYLRQLRVVLCNRYYRWYFATRDQRFRVTVDAEMAFYRMKRANNRFVHRYADHRNIVVELKYEKALDVQAEKVSGFFPFSVTKNSKYVTGIKRVYL